MQDTENKGERGGRVFSYVTDPETRSFRSIAQKIQKKKLPATEILMQDAENKGERGGRVFSYVTDPESRSF